jgi:hypothetical protein
MKHTLVLAAALGALTLSVQAADPTPKDAITNAAVALSSKANYSWKQTVAMGQDSPFTPGPTEGQTEKDGFTVVKSSFGENTMQVVKKGDKTAMNGPDGNWMNEADMAAGGQGGPGGGRGMGMGMMFRNIQMPAEQAQQIAAVTKELKKDGDVYSGELTEDGVKSLLFGGRGGRGGRGPGGRGPGGAPGTNAPADAPAGGPGGFGPGGNGPDITGAKGSAKFWVKDGALTKIEYTVKGNMSFGGNDMAMDRTTTIEIKDVGTTKVTVPDEAKKKLQ